MKMVKMDYKSLPKSVFLHHRSFPYAVLRIRLLATHFIHALLHLRVLNEALIDEY